LVDTHFSVFIAPLYKEARCAVTTSWDDGRDTDIKIAKILQRYNIAGTFYVPVSVIDSKDYLSRKKLIDLSKRNEIASHSISHPILNLLSDLQLKKEIFNSKKVLENILSNFILGFCYPYGVFNNRVKTVVSKAGYGFARTTRNNNVSFTDDWFEFSPTLEATLEELIVAKAKLFFDAALRLNGVWHLWGQTSHIERHDLWGELYEILSYVTSTSKKVWYAQNQELYKYRREIEHTMLSILSKSSDHVACQIKLFLNNKIFDHPITLVFKVYKKWSNAEVYVGEKRLSHSSVNQYFGVSHTKICVSLKPTSKIIVVERA